MVRPEISKILEPAVIHNPGRLWLVLRSFVKEARKADHICGGIERITRLLRSA